MMLFFDELEKLNNDDYRIPFQIIVFDRIELCSKEDLESYNRFNIIPGLGLETGSSSLLCRLGKFMGKNNNLQNANEYLNRAEELIKQANNLNIPIVFLCMGAAPGSDEKTIIESSNFFFGKRFSGKSLIERYKVNLQFEKFAIFPGSTFYEKGEKMFNAKYYYKEWWKIFDKYQAAYSTMIRPSKNISFPETMNTLINFLRKLYKSQLKLRNPSYNLIEFSFRIKMYQLILKLFEGKEKILQIHK